MPIDYSKYPVDWKQIRQRILEREDHKCKTCGVPNYAKGRRGKDGRFWIDTGKAKDNPPRWEKLGQPMRIVLTISHADHDITNNAEDNLAALCQRCHLLYDMQHLVRAAPAA